MKNEKSKIKLLYIDKKGDSFYINAEYEVTDSFGNVYEYRIKRLPMPIFDDPRDDQGDMYAYSDHYYKYDRYINLGFGNLRCTPETVVETKLVHSTTKKMTIKEIEKALGHKVEIVS